MFIAFKKAVSFGWMFFKRYFMLFKRNPTIVQLDKHANFAPTYLKSFIQQSLFKLATEQKRQISILSLVVFSGERVSKL